MLICKSFAAEQAEFIPNDGGKFQYLEKLVFQGWECHKKDERVELEKVQCPFSFPLFALTRIKKSRKGSQGPIDMTV